MEDFDAAAAVLEQYELQKVFPINVAMHVLCASGGDWRRVEDWFAAPHTEAPDAWPCIQSYMRDNRAALDILFEESQSLARLAAAPVEALIQ